MSQSDVAEYIAKRAAFINDDRALRPDYANAAGRSAVEIEADRVIREIRAFEAFSIWDGEHKNIQHPFPGMEFLTGTRLIASWNNCLCIFVTARDIIVQTRLFKILTKVALRAQ
jgi:adenosine deaminase CECR1